MNLTLLAYQIRRFRLRRADADNTAWLQSVLNREGAAFGCDLRLQQGHRLALHWRAQPDLAAASKARLTQRP